jgi:uncharacterized alkaline shock family protein YloU
MESPKPTPNEPDVSQPARSERAQNEPMSIEQKLGNVQVSPKVLATLARLTAASVPGVISVGKPAPKIASWISWLPWKRRTAGVSLETRPEGVDVNVDVVVAQGKNIIDVASQTQAEISTAIEKMVGFPVRQVNVRVVDVR